ncbi:RICIN domain-containing protein [Dactylosporangium sp. CA-152071]
MGDRVRRRPAGRLTVCRVRTADSTPVGQYDCHGGADQKWWWS